MHGSLIEWRGAAVFADVTDWPAPPRLVGQVLPDLGGSGPWSGGIGSLDAGDDLDGAGRGQDRQGPCWAEVSWLSARSSPAGMICWTRIRPGTYRISSHTPIGYTWSPGCTAALPEAGLAVVRAAGQHGKAPSLPGRCTEYALAHGRATARGRHPGSAGVRHLSFPEPPDSTADDARHFRIERIPEGITNSR
jgi:hypothetical protein